MEDPFDWSVDQVVAALCNATTSWTQSKAVSPLPEFSHFERALRDNEVTGSILLTQVDHASLREDLGLKILGHRGTIMLAIHKLRGQSQKWKEHIQEVAAQTPLPGSGVMMSPGPISHSGLGTPLYGSPVFVPPSAGNMCNGYRQSPAVSPQRAQQHEREGVLLDKQPFTDESYFRPDTNDDIHHEAIPDTPKLRRSEQQQSSKSSPVGVVKGPHANQNGGQHSPSRGSPSVKNGRTATNGIMEDSALHANSANISVVLGSNHRRGETYIIDDSGRKRRKLNLMPIEPATNNHTDVGIHEQLHQQSEDKRVIEDTANAEETLMKGSDGIGPSEKPASMDVDHDIQPLVDEAIATTLVPTMDHNSSTCTSLEPGKLSIDANGRKRMVPMLVSHLDDNVIPELGDVPEITTPLGRTAKSTKDSKEVEKSTQGQRSDRKPRQTYLGPKAFPVDEVFYGKSVVGEEVKIDIKYETLTDLGQPSQSDTDFIPSTDISPIGQRLYVHALMKRFLSRSERKDFRRHGQAYTAIIPYSERIGRKHQTQSFTLYTHSPSTIIATREDLSKWPAARDRTDPKAKDQSDPDSAITLFNVPDDDPFGLRQGTNENHDWDFLDKWHYTDDKPLPVYGESGSEGEYDLETWREIEKENGTLERAEIKSSRKQLTDTEVSSAIDQGIEDIKAKWRTKKLPLIEHRAWRIWTKSRKDRNKHQQINEATARIDYLDNVRSAKLRKEMLSEIWSNVIQVKKQCKILKETVFEREQQTWRVSVLRSRSPPPKPQPETTIRRKKPPSIHDSIADDEEILSSESDRVESSDDGLDSFIVEDDESEAASGAEAEILTDTERVLDADDEHVLDGGNGEPNSDEEVVTPTKRRKQVPRGKSYSP